MNWKKVGIVVFIIFCLLPIHKISAQTTNVGFIPSNIWYSKDPFEEGDKIKIYTFLFNPDEKELSGTVVFYDKTILLGRKNFIVGAKEVKDISIDWTVSVGEHTIFGKIENAKFLISAGKYEEAIIGENKTAESSRTVRKKIIVKLPDNLLENVVSDQQIQNIEKFIVEKTPDFISKPLVLGANTVEEFRSNIGAASENKKGEVSNQIKILNNEKNPPDSKTNTNFQKPLKYIELFFLTIFSIILNNKWIFYIVLALIVFFLARFIWRKIF